ncbi:MAG: YgjV family protein [Clostridia bacterium]|nr:YgjV family protein [Clostridia bacterium]
MTTFEIISQVFGAFGLIGTVIGDNQKKKLTVLLAFIFANIMYALQYVFLYAWPGMIICIIAIIRSIVYYQFEKNNKPKSLFVLILFLLIGIISGGLSYQDIFSTIPLLSTLAFTWALWQSDLRKFRVVALIEPIAFFFYDLHVGAYVGMIVTALEFVGALIAIIRLDIIKKETSGGNDNKV